jgi:hypothetical protein
MEIFSEEDKKQLRETVRSALQEGYAPVHGKLDSLRAETEKLKALLKSINESAD